jgi:hypothetical protein
MRYSAISFLLCLTLVTTASADKLPDLFTLGFLNHLSPDELHPGDMLNLDFSVANNATVCIPEFPCEEIFGPAYGPWQEAVFLSIDSVPDPEDILLGTVSFNGVLQPGGAHEVDMQFQIPGDCPTGNYKVIVYGDYVDGQPEGQVQEHKETNNWDACNGRLGIISHLLLVSPNGGESLSAGSTYTINWEDDRGDSNCPSDYLLDYSTDNGQTWIPVDSNYVSNTCSYDWLVPDANSEECLIRVIDANDLNIYDTSDDTFTIYKCTLTTDLTGDCVINLYDFAVIAADWLACGNPFDPNCIQ